jgi:hypothetical protein
VEVVGVGIGVVAIMAFFVMWPPGPVLTVALGRGGGGGARKVVARAGHRCCARETGVEAMGVDEREYNESCEAEGGGPLLALRRREGKPQSPLSLRLRRPHPRVPESAASPPLLELGI